MVALFVETLLLMAAAYFVGASVACLVRRSLYAPQARAVPVERRVDPLPEIARTAAAPFKGDRQTPVVTAPVASSAVAPADDLKRICLIDETIEAGLGTLGVRRYEQIAAWTATDVSRIGKALSLEGRINQQNWIEQAQILAKGGETYFAKRRARGETARAWPTADEGDRGSPPPAVAVASLPDVSARAAFAQASPVLSPSVPSVQPVPAVPVRLPASLPHDNLLRISGVDVAIQQVLASMGVTRYSQIAHWSPADVDRTEKELGVIGRIAQENWIEQAQILSRGGDTAFSRSFDRRDPNSVVTERAPTARRTDLGALRSVRSEAYQPTEPGPGAAQRVMSQSKVGRLADPNDLKRIRGIGVLIEKKLNSMGVTSYEQIADWTAADIAHASQALDFKGRIERENWVEQARILASGGATEFSRRVDRGEVETSRYRP